MNATTTRIWLVRWMYGVGIVHLAVSAALPWIADAAVFDSYHRGIEAAFWNGPAPDAARAQQIWWIGLFGPTVQGLSLWMLALTRIGDRHRSRFAWGTLVAGVMLWAPQDMLISLRAGCWTHVWIDCVAVLAMLPPLVWLWYMDGRQVAVSAGNVGNADLQGAR